MLNIPLLEKKSRQLRATCIQMANDGNVGHLSSSLSCIDILVALYYYWLNIYSFRFILSKGHGCTSLYAVLADIKFIPKEWLFEYAKNNSHLPNHPCKYALPLLEISSGSLGHGLGIATGMAYGFKLNNSNIRIIILMSDGECNEGSVWESAMFACANKFDNILVIVDYNGMQAVGKSDEIMGYTSLEEKFKSFGWKTRTVDGNNIYEIIKTLDEVPFNKDYPSAIIAKTKVGISFMEGDILWHYRIPSDEDLSKALQELGEKPIYLIEKKI